MMTCSRRDGVVDCGMAECKAGRTWVGFLPVAPHKEPGVQLHLPAAGRRREERAAHKMHRRRGSYAQRGSHVHEIFCHVSHSGRYIRAPTARVHCACTILRLLRPGTSPSDLSTRRALALVKPQL